MHRSFQHTVPLSANCNYGPGAQEFADHQSILPHHTTLAPLYSNVDVVGHLRTADGLTSNSTGTYDESAGDGLVFGTAHQATTQDIDYHSYTAGQQGHNSDSISASPDSTTSSSFIYSNHPVHPYTSITNLSQHQQAAVSPAYPYPPQYSAGSQSREHYLLDGTSPGTLSLQSPVLTSHFTTGATTNPPHSLTGPLNSSPYSSRPAFTGAVANDPRHQPFSTTQTYPSSVPPPAVTSMGSRSQKIGVKDYSSTFPWPELQIYCGNKLTCEGQVVVPNIDARMDKNFGYIESGYWATYRRNYAHIVCSYTLSPHIRQGRLFYGSKQVQAMGMRLSASVDGPGGKTIELVRYTPKRDYAYVIEVQKMIPAAPHLGLFAESARIVLNTTDPSTLDSPFLPLQLHDDKGPPPEPVPTSKASKLRAERGIKPKAYPSGPQVFANDSTNMRFDRVQFKVATLNNGKRRASQQHFHVNCELLVDIRTPGEKEPQWEKLAALLTERCIVRGRSPSHYKDEKFGIPPFRAWVGEKRIRWINPSQGSRSGGGSSSVATIDFGAAMSSGTNNNVGGFRAAQSYEQNDVVASSSKTNTSGKRQSKPKSRKRGGRNAQQAPPVHAGDDEEMYDFGSSSRHDAVKAEEAQQQQQQQLQPVQIMQMEPEPILEPEAQRDDFVFSNEFQQDGETMWTDQDRYARYGNFDGSRGYYNGGVHHMQY